MHLTCTGLSHHTASLSKRERFQIPRAELTSAVDEFKRFSGAQECAVLATCNRVEFYRADQHKPDLKRDLAEFYRRRLGHQADELSQLLFTRQGSSAVRHLLRVTAGLDSALLGETQITHQVREAYSAACAADGPGAILHKLFHVAFQTSKTVRRETEMSADAPGLGWASISFLKDSLGLSLTGARVVVCGVNQTVEQLLPRLSAEQARIVVVNRTLDRATKVARPYGAQARPLDDLKPLLADCDFLFTATSAQGWLITREDLRERPPEGSLNIIDLGMPRNVEPNLADLPGVTIFDLDDLKRFSEKTLRERSLNLPYALDLVDGQVSAFEVWLRRRHDPASADIRTILERDREEVLLRFKDQFRLSDQKALEAFSRQLFRQFLRRAGEAEAVQPPLEIVP